MIGHPYSANRPRSLLPGLKGTLCIVKAQFLYCGSQGSVNPEPQEAAFRYIISNSAAESGSNIVFMAHLGDLTEDAEASSFQRVGQAFDILDSRRVAYNVLAGNHDGWAGDVRIVSRPLSADEFMIAR